MNDKEKLIKAVMDGIPAIVKMVLTDEQEQHLVAHLNNIKILHEVFGESVSHHITDLVDNLMRRE